MSLSLCPRVIHSAKEISHTRKFRVVSPCGTASELSFLSWECLSDVARKAAEFFKLTCKSPIIKLESGTIPKQTTELVCFVNGDTLIISEQQ